MRAKIIKALLFPAIAVALMLALTPLFQPDQPEELTELEGLGTVDYLVMGDSEGWVSVQPMELWRSQGYTGYNLSRAGQRLQDFYLQLKDTLATQRPEVLLLETDILYKSVGLIGESEGFLTTLLCQSIPFLRYHERWSQLLSGPAEAQTASQRDVFRGAYYNPVVSPYTGGDYTQPTDRVKALPLTQRYFADKIVRLCRDNGIQLILYSAPSPLCWSYEMHNGLAEYAREQGLEYLDFNLLLPELGIDWSQDTQDAGDHVNAFGARKLTGYLAEYLSQHTNLADHRGEAGYEAWDEDLTAYLSATGQAQ